MTSGALISAGVSKPGPNISHAAAATVEKSLLAFLHDASPVSEEASCLTASQSWEEDAPTSPGRLLKASENVASRQEYGGPGRQGVVTSSVRKQGKAAAEEDASRLAGVMSSPFEGAEDDDARSPSSDRLGSGCRRAASLSRRVNLKRRGSEADIGEDPDCPSMSLGALKRSASTLSQVITDSWPAVPDLSFWRAKQATRTALMMEDLKASFKNARAAGLLSPRPQ
mmetsp:Transcript_5928/g.16608  ORF Transcript_5928/g.16608 Transcript_5928/m.16608 type:complete len:226 (+) Transcript_5928:75-752(+)